MKLDGPLVSTDWLAQHLADPRLRLFDATIFLKHKPEGGYIPDSGRAQWQVEHIPGAGFLDVYQELSDTTREVSFMMPAPRDFAARMAAHGVSDDSAVVLYNQGFPMWATRVWWMLRSIGFDNVAVLDGGYEKWKKEGRPVTAEVAHHAPGSLSVRPRPDMWVDKDAMLEVVAGKGPVTVNALAPAVYSGEKNQYGRAGHLPGTYNVYYGDLLDPATGEFLPPEKLRPLFAQSGALDSERVIAYCGGGISATMDALAMLVCGQDKVAIYDGSMSEWVKDPSLPLKLGMEP
jgi:thiosulfate/3-mercaptopyruvate sulfurtransferase